jgi:site-specific DNA-cytosine methylase
LIDICTGFKGHSSTVSSLTYPTEKLVETVDPAVTVLENVMSMVTHLDSVELYVTDAIKKGDDFDWIRSAGCSFHYQGIEDGIVKGVTRISNPWWYKKKKNWSMNKATRQKVLKRKFQILSARQ